MLFEGAYLIVLVCQQQLQLVIWKKEHGVHKHTNGWCYWGLYANKTTEEGKGVETFESEYSDDID